MFGTIIVQKGDYQTWKIRRCKFGHNKTHSDATIGIINVDCLNDKGDESVSKRGHFLFVDSAKRHYGSLRVRNWRRRLRLYWI